MKSLSDLHVNADVNDEHASICCSMRFCTKILYFHSYSSASHSAVDTSTTQFRASLCGSPERPNGLERIILVFDCLCSLYVLLIGWSPASVSIGPDSTWSASLNGDIPCSSVPASVSFSSGSLLAAGSCFRISCGAVVVIVIFVARIAGVTVFLVSTFRIAGSWNCLVFGPPKIRLSPLGFTATSSWLSSSSTENDERVTSGIES